MRVVILPKPIVSPLLLSHAGMAGIGLQPVEGSNGTVRVLTVYKGELYAGGEFTAADYDPALHIAKWNGKNWSALGSGVNGNVTAIREYSDELFVGGDFTNAGDTETGHLAKWNGKVWANTGRPEKGNVGSSYRI